MNLNLEWWLNRCLILLLMFPGALMWQSGSRCGAFRLGSTWRKFHGGKEMQKPFQSSSSGRRHFDRQAGRYGGFSPQPPRERYQIDNECDYLYGVNCINMALKREKRKFFEIIIQEGLDVNNKKDIVASQEILNLCREMNIPRIELSKQDMNLITDDRPHQGFILKSSPLPCDVIDCLPPSSSYKYAIYCCIYEHVT